MDSKHVVSDADHTSRGRVFRYRTRHLLYITLAVCVVLGIPGLIDPVVWIVGPWFVLAPLMLFQLLFILLIPPLRRILLHRREEFPTANADGDSTRT